MDAEKVKESNGRCRPHVRADPHLHCRPERGRQDDLRDRVLFSAEKRFEFVNADEMRADLERGGTLENSLTRAQAE